MAEIEKERKEEQPKPSEDVVVLTSPDEHGDQEGISKVTNFCVFENP